MTPIEGSVLALNAGSSSLKYALFDHSWPPARIRSGTIDRIGSPRAPTHAGALHHLLERLAEMPGAAGFAAVGHRVVHGGPSYRDPQLVDDAMLTELRRISSFDPEHLPSAIALMEVVAATLPNVQQVACFDTACHSAMPRVARLLPIPRRYESKGLRRYGFHGLSYAYLMLEHERLAGAAAANGRVILAHLGNGASMAAVRDGHSVDTTMAFTPAAGLMMSTRSGDLDPGLMLFLERTEQMTVSQADHMINQESGLLGVSETSSDMRDLLARESEDVRAAEAVALFCYQARKWIGAYAAVLGGLDTLIFAGGIGENAAPVRARICEGLEFLGIQLDDSRNAAHAGVVSADTSRVRVRIIRTDEESMIASAVYRVLGHGAATQGLTT